MVRVIVIYKFLVRLLMQQYTPNVRKYRGFRVNIRVWFEMPVRIILLLPVLNTN